MLEADCLMPGSLSVCLSVSPDLLIWGGGCCAGRNTVWAASFNAEHTGHRHELDKCGSGSKQITSSDRICYFLTDQSFSEQGTQTTGWWFYILFLFLNKPKVVLLSTIYCFCWYSDI